MNIGKLSASLGQFAGMTQWDLQAVRGEVVLKATIGIGGVPGEVGGRTSRTVRIRGVVKGGGVGERE